MSALPGCGIAVMAKVPRPGRAKTRLCPPLVPAESARMGAAFLRDVTANLALAAEAAPIGRYVAYAPAGDERGFDGLLAEGTGLILADGAGIEAPGVAGFGRCLLGAVRAMFARGHAAACVLNADSPTLPTARLREAATLLLAAGGAGRAVLGASEDGGYYLLGTAREHAALFADIDWSTDRVADQTRARIRDAGLELVELPPWYDVDDRAALERLLAEVSAPAGVSAGADVEAGGGIDDDAPHAAPATAALVRELGLAARLRLPTPQMDEI